jgi:hypothetical protein
MTDGDPAAELLALLSDEFAAGGIETEIVASDGDVPAQLVVALDGAVANVCFLPELENPPVLQYIVALDGDVVPGAEAAVARFVATVNSSLPLTGFEFSEAASAVVFRHVQALSVHPLDPAVVAWPLSMIHYAVSHYAPMIAAVAGGQDLDTAVAMFTDAQRELFDEA